MSTPTNTDNANASTDTTVEALKQLLRDNRHAQQNLLQAIIAGQTNATIASEAQRGQGNIPTQLPTFSGKPSENLSTWAFVVESQFDARNIMSDQRVNFAIRLLRGTALQWFHNIKLAEKNNVPGTLSIASW